MYTKICSGCKRVKPLSDFNKNKAKPDGLQSYCRSCSQIKNAHHYRHNEKTRQRIYARNKQWRKDVARRIFDYLLDHPCVDCGERNPVLLQFDHIDKKVSELSKLITKAWSWERISEEIVKCEVRCANCHTLRTARQFNWLSLQLAREKGFKV